MKNSTQLVNLYNLITISGLLDRCLDIYNSLRQVRANIFFISNLDKSNRFYETKLCKCSVHHISLT